MRQGSFKADTPPPMDEFDTNDTDQPSTWVAMINDVGESQ
jgi:hypothetical protein